MGSLSPVHWIIILFFAAQVIPLWVICRKAGFSGLWALLYFVPVVGTIGLWILAYARWKTVSVDMFGENDRHTSLSEAVAKWHDETKM